MSNFHSDISLYCVVNSPRVKPPWDNKAVSTGNFENKIVDKLATELDISIVHDPKETPYFSEDHIVLPPKTFYNNPTSYYHTILHELGHKLSVNLWQTKKFSKDAYKFVAMTGEMADFVELTRNVLIEGTDYFKQDKFISLLKNQDYTKEELQNTVTNLALLYSKEETKVEIAAMKMLVHAGFRLDKHNVEFSKYVCGAMERVNNILGRSLIEQSKSDPNFKKEFDDLIDVYKHLYNEAKKEIGKSKSNDRER
jgi:antirestriction protein ArdC